MARAPVSKTGGWGFETLRPCHPPYRVGRPVAAGGGPSPGRAPSSILEEVDLAKLDPAQFVREVRQEVSRVTWPSRKETLVTTGLVLGMSALAAVFFLLADQLIQLVMRFVFKIG